MFWIFKRKGAKKKAKPGSVRFFREPEVKFIRMGRELVYRGAFGRFDLNAERLEIIDADITMADTQLKTKKLSLDLGKNELAARGEVEIEEGKAHLKGEALKAQPTLAGMKFEGRFHLYAEDRETADALLKSGKL